MTLLWLNIIDNPEAGQVDPGLKIFVESLKKSNLFLSFHSNLRYQIYQRENWHVSYTVDQIGDQQESLETFEFNEAPIDQIGDEEWFGRHSCTKRLLNAI